MHIYIFGSLCRGDFSLDSDVDLLALTDSFCNNISPDKFSIYSYRRIEQLWKEGNPFAWHLFYESKLIFASNSFDFIGSLGQPNMYITCYQDCLKFYSLFQQTKDRIVSCKQSIVFDISIIFLCMRNIATCFSLGVTARPNFSRKSAISIGEYSIDLDIDTYRTLENARMLCTRGTGWNIKQKQIEQVKEKIHIINIWMNGLLKEAKSAKI